MRVATGARAAHLQREVRDPGEQLGRDDDGLVRVALDELVDGGAELGEALGGPVEAVRRADSGVGGLHHVLLAHQQQEALQVLHHRVPQPHAHLLQHHHPARSRMPLMRAAPARRRARRSERISRISVRAALGCACMRRNPHSVAGEELCAACLPGWMRKRGGWSGPRGAWSEQVACSG